LTKFEINKSNANKPLKMALPLFYFILKHFTLIFSVFHLSILQDSKYTVQEPENKYSKAFPIKPKYFHEPILWIKCMMVGRGRLTASPREKMHDDKGPRTNVQMEVFSWTHLIEKLLDRTIPLAFIMEKMQMAIYSLTYPSHTVNFHLSYLLIV
jgi:hypothetical protein